MTPRAYFPLPDAAALLRGFRVGGPARADVCPVLVQLGAHLVGVHRQYRSSERRIRAYRDEPLEDGHRWAITVGDAMTLRDEIATAVWVIDTEVHFRRRSNADLTAAIWVTETLGAVITRMAGLWVVVADNSVGTVDLPEARELNSLRVGYDALIAGLNAGILRLPEHEPGRRVRPA